MEEKKDKYRLLKNKDGKIVLHGDEEKRKFEVETDETAMTKKEYLSYLDNLKREADR